MDSNTSVMLGQGGCVVIATAGTLNSAPAGRPWEVIQVINDAKFYTLTNTIGTLNGTGDSLANVTLGTAITINAGTCLYGSFTGLRLHSGVVVAYFGI